MKEENRSEGNVRMERLFIDYLIFGDFNRNLLLSRIGDVTDLLFEKNHLRETIDDRPILSWIDQIPSSVSQQLSLSILQYSSRIQQSFDLFPPSEELSETQSSLSRLIFDFLPLHFDSV